MSAHSTPPALLLRVTRNEEIAGGIHLLEFRHPQGHPLPEFTAGAHIGVHVPKGMLRKYSLCNDPAERERYQIAVKRETNGRGGSRSLIDDAKAGDELTITAPVNDFGLPPRAQDFLFIAGGIGVTPIMAMILLSVRTRRISSSGQARGTAQAGSRRRVASSGVASRRACPAFISLPR